jgi:hypothetical protein
MTTARIELRPGTGVEMTSGRRRRNVMKGEGMVTPVKPLLLDGERIYPPRTRLIWDHPAVREPRVVPPLHDGRQGHGHPDARDARTR